MAAVDTQVNTTTGTVMLRANFDNADERLFPSQFVNVVMLLDTLKGVVRVPARAVQRGAPGSYVYLVDAQNTVAVHPIKLGAQDGDFYRGRVGPIARRCGRHRRRRPLARRRQGEHSGPVQDACESRGAERRRARTDTGKAKAKWCGQAVTAMDSTTIGPATRTSRPGRRRRPLPLPPGQPPAPVTPQPPAQQAPAPRSSSNPP